MSKGGSMVIVVVPSPVTCPPFTVMFSTRAALLSVPNVINPVPKNTGSSNVRIIFVLVGTSVAVFSGEIETRAGGVVSAGAVGAVSVISILSTALNRFVCDTRKYGYHVVALLALILLIVVVCSALLW
jgi:hypothetical protein